MISEETKCQLLYNIADINPAEIAAQIQNDSLKRFCESFQKRMHSLIDKIEANESTIEQSETSEYKVGDKFWYKNRAGERFFAKIVNINEFRESALKYALDLTSQSSDFSDVAFCGKDFLDKCERII